MLIHREVHTQSLGVTADVELPSWGKGGGARPSVSRHPPTIPRGRPERGGRPGSAAGPDERRALPARPSGGHLATRESLSSPPGFVPKARLHLELRSRKGVGAGRPPGTGRPGRETARRLHTDLLVDLLQAMHGLLVQEVRDGPAGIQTQVRTMVLSLGRWGGLKFSGALGREVGLTQICHHRAPREPPQGTGIDFI